MKLSEHGYRELLVIFIVCLAVGLICVRYLPVLAVIPGGFFLFCLSFFRDPDRSIPQEPGILVSPADGTVADVKEVEEEQVLNERCVRIGIFLSVFNVHVNRSPGAGEVKHIQYQRGEFHNAMSEKAAEENESNAVSVSSRSVSYAVKQIAGLIARRIVCTLEEGDQVERGQRIGMIKFGSRTELYVPAEADPTVVVEEGDTVKGGETILVQLNEEDQ